MAVSRKRTTGDLDAGVQTTTDARHVLWKGSLSTAQAGGADRHSGNGEASGAVHEGIRRDYACSHHARRRDSRGRDRDVVPGAAGEVAQKDGHLAMPVQWYYSMLSRSRSSAA